MKKIYVTSYMLILSFVAFAQENRTTEKPIFNDDPSGRKITEYIYTNIRPSEEALRDSITGTVIIQFQIDVDGSVVDTKIFRSAHPVLDAEALRLFNSMPKWTPVYNRGKPVKSQMIIWAVHFFFKNDGNERQWHWQGQRQ